jgi:hypothetical protein
MLSNSPSKVDQDARVLREAFEWLVVGGDDHAIANAARELYWFCKDHPEYAICRMWPPADVPVVEAPKRIASKFGSHCKGCSVFIAPGSECWWTPNEKGVACLKCGGSK